MDDTADATDQTLNLSRCVNDAIDVWTKNWLILAVAALLVSALSVLSLFILTGPLAGGIAWMTLEAMRREDKTVLLGDLFRDFSVSRLFDRFLPLIGLFIIETAAVIVGLFLCVIPGVILTTLWLYCFLLVVDKDLGVFASLRVSKDVVMYKGFWMNLVLALIGMALEIGAHGIPYVGVVISWFIAPIGWLILSSAYIQLVDEDSGRLHTVIHAEQECARMGV